MNELEGRVGIVSGAASPIGRSIAESLHAHGMALMLADADEEGLESLAGELSGAMTQVGDLSEEAVVREMVAATLERHGRIDALVNNAGGGVIRPFLEHDAASFATTLNRNLWTTLWCCHAVLPEMAAAGYGRIVNLGADSVRNGLWDGEGSDGRRQSAHRALRRGHPHGTPGRDRRDRVHGALSPG